ncbi:MAG: DUF1109 family protein [Sphingomonas sp.]|nr:DUF1109 family protein [Sphingomonas sp.]
MNSEGVTELIGVLAADAEPVRPLRAPWVRALATLAILTTIGGLAIVLLSSVSPFAARAGERQLAALELLAMFATGALGVTAAFHLSVPGCSRRWIAAPLPAFAAWLLLSGIGCYRDLVRRGAEGLALGHSMDCLLFILASSLLVGLPLLWRLSRARPIDPLPVAFTAALGAAALSALLLQFFHPFTVTFVDLAVHLAAVGAVVGLGSLFSRKTLRPA